MGLIELIKRRAGQALKVTSKVTLNALEKTFSLLSIQVFIFMHVYITKPLTS